MTTESSKVGVLSWYEEHVPSMPLATAKKHMLDLETCVRNFEGRTERPEFEAALKLVVNRVDELLPKVPASIAEHDHSVGDKVAMNWPDHLPQATMYVHMHLCELLHSWNISPHRAALDPAFVGESDEAVGRTAFIFPTRNDAHRFIEHYSLDDFKVNEQLAEKLDGDPVWVVTFTNRFEPDQVNSFLNIYHAAIMNLSVLYDERRRAVSMDNGRFGFVTADHFTQREAIELNRISAARELLGRGYKNLNKS